MHACRKVTKYKDRSCNKTCEVEHYTKVMVFSREFNVQKANLQKVLDQKNEITNSLFKKHICNY